ncbi:hypothetical protein [Actinomycetospora sp. NBRC 106378]|uniref:hypothetical protein n=1 Tax=Actinomycetospora sp. NBRC 106378 TaxID=3032208 RepID=UPI0024A40551|nr:hypothetical protein [Actinomycetospora sp. NBRC 106378]GLZ53787.1 hypothetical protein Acsp07_34040 [Actinomycetospora sp. NBRC 106378]
MADPMAMRRAVAGYVEGIHAAYAQQAATFPPAVRGRMPLLAAGRFTVVAAGARHLHVLATTEPLGPLRGEEVELPGSLDGLDWRVRFYDPVVLPALGLIDEGQGPRPDEVRGTLGISTVLYHLVTQPGSGLSPHHAGHVGSGLAAGHSAAARDFDALRSRARGREALVDEMQGAATAGLARAQVLLARAIAPHNAPVSDAVDAALRPGSAPDPDAVRRVLVAALGGTPAGTAGAV